MWRPGIKEQRLGAIKNIALETARVAEGTA